MTRFATTPAAWSNEDDRTIGADIDLETCLAEAAEAGFEGIEDGYKFPRDAGELTSVLGGHGLALAAVTHGLHLLDRSVEEERDAIRPAIDRAKAGGTDVVIVKEVSNAIFSEPDTPLSKKPELTAQDWDSFGLKLEQIATLCADEGLTCVYHHYMGTVVQTPDEIDRLMMETGPNLHLLFDTAQCYFGGGDPVQLLTRHMPRVRHFHAGNVRVSPMAKARMSDVSLPQAVRMGVFTVPGDRDGSVDFKTCLNLLSASSFDGWIVCTAGQDPAERDPAKLQAMGLRTLRDLAGATGIAA
jgi:inosose dehydratase